MNEVKFWTILVVLFSIAELVLMVLAWQTFGFYGAGLVAVMSFFSAMRAICGLRRKFAKTGRL